MKKTFYSFALASLFLGAVACGNQAEQTQEESTDAVETVDDTVDQAEEAIEDTAAQAEESVDNAADQVEQAVSAE
ncbi:MAG: hypothetical protein M9887_04630 [Chitinophagales bacterium]|nr:hypothetical protein [Chitinophagales bacterium]